MAIKFNPFTGNLDLIDTTAAAGSDTQVQYNDGGSLAGSADLTWDDTGKELSVGGDINSQNVETTGVFSAAGGAAATPSITFTGDLNTGIYSPGANQVAISTNGTGRLFVDASGKVGVGTASPSTTLEVIGDAKIGETSSYQVRIAASSSTGVIEYPATSVRSVIRTLGTTPLEFEINSSPVARIDSAGRFLVGTSSESGGSLFQVNDDRIRIASSKTPASASDTGTAGEICWDSSYIYVCTATDTWKRAALSTW